MDAPHIPLVEANQGLLSIVALAIALGAVVWEHWRLLHASRAELRKDVTVAAGVVRMVLAAIDAAGPTPATRAKGDIAGLARDCAGALKAVCGSRSHTAAYAYAVMDAANHLAHFAGIAAQVDGANPYATSWRPSIELKLKAIDACLPGRKGLPVG